MTHMSVVLAVSTADPPFDKETTDLILRTSDHVEFHVWKGILAEASPVFEDMFVLQQPRQEKPPPLFIHILGISLT